MHAGSTLLHLRRHLVPGPRPVEEAVFFHVVMRRQATREIVQVNFKTTTAAAGTWAVFGNHWPSRSGGQFESAGYRAIAGETLSYFHQRVLEVHGPQTPMLAMGTSTTNYSTPPLCDMHSAPGSRPRSPPRGRSHSCGISSDPSPARPMAASISITSPTCWTSSWSTKHGHRRRTDQGRSSHGADLYASMQAPKTKPKPSAATTHPRRGRHPRRTHSHHWSDGQGDESAP
jgi:hypothetical protein